MTEPRSVSSPRTASTHYARIDVTQLYLFIEDQLRGRGLVAPSRPPEPGEPDESAKLLELPFLPQGNHPFIGDKSRFMFALHEYRGDFREILELTGTVECHVPSPPGSGHIIYNSRVVPARMYLQNFALNRGGLMAATIILEWPAD